MKLPWLVSQCAALFTTICYYNFELIRSDIESTRAYALHQRLNTVELTCSTPKTVDKHRKIPNFLHAFYIVCKIAIDWSDRVHHPILSSVDWKRWEKNGRRKGSLTVWLPLTIWCIAFNTSAVFPSLSSSASSSFSFFLLFFPCPNFYLAAQDVIGHTACACASVYAWYNNSIENEYMCLQYVFHNALPKKTHANNNRVWVSACTLQSK